MKKISELFRKHWWAWVGMWLSIYFLTHLIYLTNLPVFADEAIYIRWAQLMMDDLTRYVFFPLNDGKTPLFIWMLVPFQYLFSDPLASARFVSVLGGGVQVWITMLIIKNLGGKRLAEGIGASMVIFLPFWFMHHRMALMDGWLTVWISAAFLAVIKIINSTHSKKIEKISLSGKVVVIFLVQLKMIFSFSGLWVWLGGLFLGLSLLTKVPAILTVTSMLVLTLMPPRNNWQRILARLINVGVIIFLGGLILASLKVSAAFPQLISRGSDFLYPLSEVVLNGAWQQTVISFPTYFVYFWVYLTPGVIVLLFAGLLEKQLRARHIVLVGAGLAFVLPIAILGKVVYPRYYLPSVIYFTVAASLVGAFYLERVKEQMSKVSVGKQLLLALIVIMLLQQIVTPALTAASFSWGDSNQYPYVPADRQQYLTEWSSGHGIAQFVDLLTEQSQDRTIAVATEGFFGTLPDGVLMYLHNKDVSHVSVEGVGQPISGIPTELVEKADDYDHLWLLVNSHRLLFSIPEQYMIAQYCRPDGAPCLQVWDLTEIIARQRELQ